MTDSFDYQTAFSRNIGWVTEAEQSSLATKRVAIAGMGGVGGGHVLTLSRLGLTKFNLSDFDEFELPNFNRQVGATISQLNRPKLDVLSEMAIDINPEIQCNTFPSGVNSENLHQFLEGVDLYVDALDFFALETRRAVFQACAEKEIPAITAAPLGMGVAFLCFMPGGMTFEEYFQLEGYSEDEKLLRFLLGLSPSMLQASYLADKTRVDLAAHKGPSTMMACDLCAGVAGTMALKVLLGRGKVPVAPKGLHFDAYRNKMKVTWRPWGNRNPVQKLGLLIARKKLGSQLSKSP